MKAFAILTAVRSQDLPKKLNILGTPEMRRDCNLDLALLHGLRREDIFHESLLIKGNFRKEILL